MVLKSEVKIHHTTGFVTPTGDDSANRPNVPVMFRGVWVLCLLEAEA